MFNDCSCKAKSRKYYLGTKLFTYHIINSLLTKEVIQYNERIGVPRHSAKHRSKFAGGPVTGNGDSCQIARTALNRQTNKKILFFDLFFSFSSVFRSGF
jgi:hypothetical protein